MGLCSSSTSPQDSPATATGTRDEAETDEGLDRKCASPPDMGQVQGSEERNISADQPSGFPMYVIKMGDFLELDLMTPHQTLLAKGLIAPWNRPLHGPVNFISHQWLSSKHPDPDRVQLRAVQELFRRIKDGANPFKTKEDWERYSKRWDYTDAEVVGGDEVQVSDRYEEQDGGGVLRMKSYLNKRLEVVSMEHFRKSVTDGCVWLDYASIPQLGARDKALATQEDNAAFWNDQERAVQSIPDYCARSTNFWVVAPPAKHIDHHGICDLASWRRRGWCRLEDWVNELSLKANRPLILSASHLVDVEDFTDKLTHRALPRFSVLLGDFTCCKFGHVLDGQPMPCDKIRVSTVLNKAYDEKLKYLHETEDMVNYAWFLCLRPSILAGDKDKSLLPQDESVASFLSRYGWLKDPEGGDVASQPVFFPLFCAAVEGNLPVVRGLIKAGVDSNRRLLGVGTSSLEAAAMCGHLHVCEALVDAGADLHGSSQFDGASPLIKAARGGGRPT